MTHSSPPPHLVPALHKIPLIDLRTRTPVDLARERSETALSLITAATNTLGFVSRWPSKVLLPIADKQSRAWLERSNNPYLPEIDAIASALGVPGTYALNLSYEWGCTSGAFSTGDSVTLLRLLDWPFPHIGKHVMVINQRAAAGDFYNIGWPGMSGMLNGMAPGRFAATLNQAPMRKHGLTHVGDWIKNRLLVKESIALPPPHLLRKVFEEAGDYAAARKMLIETPVALPVIYIITGLNPGEGCVIERTEHDARVFELADQPRVTVTNHFNSSFNEIGHGWSPRTEDSGDRYVQSCGVEPAVLSADGFEWVSPPMLSPLTRLGVIADAKTGRLVVQGLEGDEQVTERFVLA